MKTEHRLLAPDNHDGRRNPGEGRAMRLPGPVCDGEIVVWGGRAVRVSNPVRHWDGGTAIVTWEGKDVPLDSIDPEMRRD